MGIVLVFDGPEKAGKTTLCRRLQQHLRDNTDIQYVDYLHWTGRADPDESIYRERLDIHLGVDADYLSIWDRSWASEHIYGRLLKQNRNLANTLLEPYWALEHDNLLKYILLGPSVDQLERKRDSTDLLIPVNTERYYFAIFGQLNYEWEVIQNEWSEIWTINFLDRMARMVTQLRKLT